MPKIAREVLDCPLDFSLMPQFMQTLFKGSPAVKRFATSALAQVLMVVKDAFDAHAACNFPLRSTGGPVGGLCNRQRRAVRVPLLVQHLPQLMPVPFCSCTARINLCATPYIKVQIEKPFLFLMRLYIFTQAVKKRSQDLAF